MIVLIWDDNLQEVVSEIEFRMQVVAVVMRTERLIVATELSVFVFKIFGTETAPILFEQIETVDNPTGWCEPLLTAWKTLKLS